MAETPLRLTHSDPEVDLNGRSHTTAKTGLQTLNELTGVEGTAVSLNNDRHYWLTQDIVDAMWFLREQAFTLLKNIIVRSRKNLHSVGIGRRVDLSDYDGVNRFIDSIGADREARSKDGTPLNDVLLREVVRERAPEDPVGTERANFWGRLERLFKDLHERAPELAARAGVDGDAMSASIANFLDVLRNDVTIEEVQRDGISLEQLFYVILLHAFPKNIQDRTLRVQAVEEDLMARLPEEEHPVVVDANAETIDVRWPVESMADVPVERTPLADATGASMSVAMEPEAPEGVPDWNWDGSDSDGDTFFGMTGDPPDVAEPSLIVEPLDETGVDLFEGHDQRSVATADSGCLIGTDGHSPVESYTGEPLPADDASGWGVGEDSWAGDSLAGDELDGPSVTLGGMWGDGDPAGTMAFSVVVVDKGPEEVGKGDKDKKKKKPE